uniref:Putative secreted protein n=1 Tax=Ixodes ricinus TaxID=34613 RepID=A0A6B0UDT7_IXORI
MQFAPFFVVSSLEVIGIAPTLSKRLNAVFARNGQTQCVVHVPFLCPCLFVRCSVHHVRRSASLQRTYYLFSCIKRHQLNLL